MNAAVRKFAGPAIAILCAVSILGPIDAAAQNNNVPVLVRFNGPPGQAGTDLVRGLGGQVTHSYHIVSAVAATVPP